MRKKKKPYVSCSKEQFVEYCEMVESWNDLSVDNEADFFCESEQEDADTSEEAQGGDEEQANEQAKAAADAKAKAAAEAKAAEEARLPAR